MIKEWRKGTNMEGEGRSFANVVADKRSGDVGWGKKPLEFFTKEEVRNRFSKACVGILRCFGFAVSVSSNIVKAWFYGLRVIPLGAKKCLIKEVEDGALSDFLGKDEVWWKDWFEEVTRWNDAVTDKFKVVWLRFYGVPAVAWCSEFFMLLANQVSSFISVDELTAYGNAMDVARIQVCMGFNMVIQNTVELFIDGKRHQLVV